MSFNTTILQCRLSISPSFPKDWPNESVLGSQDLRVCKKKKHHVKFGKYSTVKKVVKLLMISLLILQ